MLRTNVKASAITNLTDARYFAAWDVEWMGFVLDPASGLYVSPQTVQAIREWIDGPGIVGEFNLQTAPEMQTAIELLNLDAIQAGMFTSAETLTELQSPLPVIKEIVVDRYSDEAFLLEQLDEFAHLAAYFLLNFEKNGLSWQQLKAESTLPLDALRSICRQHAVYLGIDLDAGSLNEILNELQPRGLSLQGGEEEKTGYKSFDEIDDIFEALEAEA